ncbi:34874_t:CDS:2, partial [Racocetra persica]
SLNDETLRTTENNENNSWQELKQLLADKPNILREDLKRLQKINPNILWQDLKRLLENQNQEAEQENNSTHAAWNNFELFFKVWTSLLHEITINSNRQATDAKAKQEAVQEKKQENNQDQEAEQEKKQENNPTQATRKNFELLLKSLTSHLREITTNSNGQEEKKQENNKNQENNQTQAIWDDFELFFKFSTFYLAKKETEQELFVKVWISFLNEITSRQATDIENKKRNWDGSELFFKLWIFFRDEIKAKQAEQKKKQENNEDQEKKQENNEDQEKKQENNKDQEKKQENNQTQATWDNFELFFKVWTSFLHEFINPNGQATDAKGPKDLSEFSKEQFQNVVCKTIRLYLEKYDFSERVNHATNLYFYVNSGSIIDHNKYAANKAANEAANEDSEDNAKISILRQVFKAIVRFKSIITTAPTAANENTDNAITEVIDKSTSYLFKNNAANEEAVTQSGNTEQEENTVLNEAAIKRFLSLVCSSI